jgi:branched-chain amino acid aminotransferase
MRDKTYHKNAKKYWHMGVIRDWEETPIHPMAHALHYGSSIFEGIRAYPTERGAAVFRLTEHIDRFFHSASVLGMTLPFDRPALIEAVKLTMRENGLESAYIRPLAFFSYGGLSLVPEPCAVEVIVGAWERGAYLGEQSVHGVSAYLLSSPRIHPRQLDTSAKLGGLYVQSVINSVRARALGCDEGLFLNWEGDIAEGTGENIFLVKDGVVKTNDGSASILEGITRTSVLEIARDLGLETAIGPMGKGELWGADEAFFTGTAAEIAPIVRVLDGSSGQPDGEPRVIGTGEAGPVTRQLIEAYGNAVRGRTERYRRWLAWVAD